MKLTKTQLVNLMGYFIVIIILIAVFRLSFWEFNIFKKEKELPPEVLEIKKEIDFIKSLKISEMGMRLNQFLPSPKTLEIPKINPDEIGKNNIFE